MKLATYTYKEHTYVGEVVDDRIYVTTTTDNMQYMIRRGLLPTRRNQSYPLEAVKLEAPLHPSKIICIGRNYAEHAKETGSAVPAAPIIFAKFPSAIVGNQDTITWSESVTKEVDWEGELTVVIGKRGKNISQEDAFKHIFGYTIGNDVSARDLQLRADAQWTRGKSLDTFGPIGPWIVTRDEIADPHKLSVKTTVNEDLRQDGNTKDFIFNIPVLINYCSTMFTLEPGDIIMTGTPPGVGEGMKPPVYLKDGDVIKIDIEGLGTLTNPCKVTA